MKHHRAILAAAGAVGLVLTTSSASFAQDTTIVEAPPQTAPQTVVVNQAPTQERTVSGYTGPNRALVGAGLTIFTLAYVPAVIVAAQSSQNADNHLYVPVVGPWLDYANRPGCGGSGPGCNSEVGAKTGIAISGVFQGIGALSTVIGLLVWEHPDQVVTASAKADKPKLLSVTPASMGTGAYGVAALGSW